MARIARVGRVGRVSRAGNTLDRVLPTLVSGVIVGDTITLTFSEPVTRLDVIADGQTSVFRKRIGAGLSDMTYVSGNGTNTAVFTATAASSGQTVQIRYEASRGGTVEDLFGNRMAYFADTTITNNTP